VTPEQFFAHLMAAEPSRPLVTYYDEATGERSELSVRSTGNWVAKTHFLLVDELGLGVGDRAFVALPAHWISVPVLLGCMSAGLELTTDAEAAQVGFVGPDAVAGLGAVPDVFAIAPGSAAIGFPAGPPEGTQDYVAAVRPQADAWNAVRFGAGDGDPAIAGASRDEVAEQSATRAAELGFGRGARVLSAREWNGPPDWVDTLLAPLAVAGSVVYMRNCPDESVLHRRYEQERCTALLPG
jgi:uncharacterized protein (TIGR03089 family)